MVGMSPGRGSALTYFEYTHQRNGIIQTKNAEDLDLIIKRIVDPYFIKTLNEYELDEIKNRSISDITNQCQAILVQVGLLPDIKNVMVSSNDNRFRLLGQLSLRLQLLVTRVRLFVYSHFLGDTATKERFRKIAGLYAHIQEGALLAVDVFNTVISKPLFVASTSLSLGNCDHHQWNADFTRQVYAHREGGASHFSLENEGDGRDKCRDFFQIIHQLRGQEANSEIDLYQAVGYSCQCQDATNAIKKLRENVDEEVIQLCQASRELYDTIAEYGKNPGNDNLKQRIERHAQEYIRAYEACYEKIRVYCPELQPRTETVKK